MTLALMLVRKQPWRLGLGYIAMQLTGAVCGCALLIVSSALHELNYIFFAI